MCRILPSDCSAASSPIWSSNGTFGSIRCSCSRSMRSTPRCRRFSSTSCRRYSGRPTGIHCPGPCRVKPTLVAMTRSSGYGCSASRIKRVGDERAVGVGGVDQRHAELDGAPQHADRLRRVRRVAPDSLSGELHGAVAEPVHRQVTAERETCPKHWRATPRLSWSWRSWWWLKWCWLTWSTPVPSPQRGGLFAIVRSTDFYRAGGGEIPAYAEREPCHVRRRSAPPRMHLRSRRTNSNGSGSRSALPTSSAARDWPGWRDDAVMTSAPDCRHRAG